MKGSVAVDLDADPATVFREITRLDEDAFDDLMASPKTRERVIDILIEEFAARFRPESAGDLDAVIHIKLWDKPGGGYDHHELRIADGTCTPSHEPSPDPDLTLKVRPSDLRKIVTGEAGPKRLAFKGRLRAIGDIRLGMRLPDLFDLSAND